MKPCAECSFAFVLLGTTAFLLLLSPLLFSPLYLYPLSSDNVLVGSNGDTVKLIDFGCSLYLDKNGIAKDGEEYEGCECYSPPEVIAMWRGLDSMMMMINEEEDDENSEEDSKENESESKSEVERMRRVASANTVLHEEQEQEEEERAREVRKEEAEEEEDDEEEMMFGQKVEESLKLQMRHPKSWRRPDRVSTKASRVTSFCTWTMFMQPWQCLSHAGNDLSSSITKAA